MAIRTILTLENEILRKKSREIEEITPRILQLIEDMKDTLKKAEGVGLAAPQVGILKRVVLIDVGEGPMVLINPEILECSGEQTDPEGCLSIPETYYELTRPMNVRFAATDTKGERKEYTAEGLFARAVCHEVDHLDGILFIDKVLPGSKKVE